MKHHPKRFIAAGVLLAFLLQAFLPAIATACDEAIPGGTSPSAPSSPSGRQSPMHHPSDKDPKVQSATDPIDLSQGDFVLSRQDIFLPGGRGLSVEISFTYRSRSGYNGPYGYGWDMSYNRRLKKLSNNNLIALRGTNRKDEFVYNAATSSYTAPLGIYDVLVQNTNGTYTLISKHGDKETYDTQGNLTRMEDRNGNALTFTYDPAGLLPISGKSAYFVNQTTGVIAREYRLTRITNTIGRMVDFAYNADGRLSMITYQGRTFTYGYDANGTGDLISVTTPATADFPSGNTTRYSYTNHNLEKITDPKGQTYLTNVYDATKDQVTSQTYGTGTSTITYGQDTNKNPTADVIDRRGFRTLFTFDTAGHIIRQEIFTDGNPVGEPASYVTSYEYNAAGERTRIVFPRGNATEMSYDVKGNLLEIRRKKIGVPKGQNDPTDIVTTLTYDSTFNFVKAIMDPLGNTTTSTYDTKGNLTQLQTPNSQKTNFTYNSFGQVDIVTDPNSNVMKHEYDSTTGYLTKVTAGFGSSDAAATTFAYDSVGNITQLRTPNSQLTQFTYNAMNQLIKVTAPAPFNFLTHYSYDANGNLIQVDRQITTTTPGTRPPLGTVSATDDWQSTVYTYTTLDQAASITDDLGNITRFTYDASGNRRTIIDAKGQTTTYDYEERDLLWKVTDSATPSGVTEYTYDLNGNLVQIKDTKGNLTKYDYDDFDRLTRTIYADTSFETYMYDAASNLSQLHTPNSQNLTYTYDSLNRLTKKTTPQKTTTYTYDPGSRLVEVSGTGTVPDTILSYTYDSLNRATQVKTASPGLTATTVKYAYDGAGNRTTLTYPDNSAVTYSYDALNRLTQLRTPDSQLISFTYDALSRRTQLGFPNGTTTTYTYDAASRLDSLSLRTPDSKTRKLTHTYDPIGNRKTVTDVGGPLTTSYTYDPLSQLTAVDYPSPGFSDTSYTYDAVGNRTKLVTSGGTQNYVSNVLNQYSSVSNTTLTYDTNGNLTSDGTRTYSYDAENRLTELRTPNSQLVGQYTYDPLGRRLTKTVNGVVTRFLYDGDDLIVETDGAGNITAKYFYSPGIDEPLRMARGSTISYYHADALGSINALSDSSGQLVEFVQYTVDGSIRITDPSGTPKTTSVYGNRFFFTGREYDSETGLYYYRARYYNPRIGRFLQRDPLGYFPDINLYRYVGNNPVNWTDPLGLWVALGSRPLRITAKRGYHTVIILHPDNPADFENDPNFKDRFYRNNRRELEATLSANPDWKPNQASPFFGNLTATPNHPDDRPEKMMSQQRILDPQANSASGNKRKNPRTDTQLIKDIFAAADKYQNNLPYNLTPTAGTGYYNSNSYTYGILRKVGISNPPNLNGWEPGADVPIPLDDT